MAEIVGIWRAPAHGEPMESLDAAQAVENHGLEGCAHARPGGKRQVLFVAAEDLEAVSVEPGTIRENLTVRGSDVMRWPVGQRLTAGDAEFEITMVCDPCELMETIRPGLQAELEGRRGMLATVVKGGDVAIGSQVVLLPVASPSL
jgi:MOSC domain-containing protein YiiM